MLILKYKNIAFLQQVLLLITSAIALLSTTVISNTEDIALTMAYLTVSINMINFFLQYYVKKEGMENEKIGLLLILSCLISSIPLRNYILILTTLVMLLKNRVSVSLIFNKKMTDWKGKKIVFAAWGVLVFLLFVYTLLLIEM